MLRKLLISSLVTCALFVAGCVPPEPEEDLIRDFDPETTVMGAIQASGTLNVGIPESPLAEEAPVSGFLSDYAALIAEALGVEAEYATGSTEELLAGIDAGTIDVAFPLLPMTETAVRRNAVSDPWYVAHQRFLIPDASPGVSPDEVTIASLPLDATVCYLLDEDTGLDPSDVREDIVVDEVTDLLDCIEDEMPAAITATDLQLIDAKATFEQRCLDESNAKCPSFRILGPQLTTVGYGAVVETGATGWLEFVTKVLEEAQAEGAWAELYDEHLAPHLEDPSNEPPGLTAEEAAALYPRDL